MGSTIPPRLGDWGYQENTMNNVITQNRIKYWSVYNQVWVRTLLSRVPNRELAAMSADERAVIDAAIQAYPDQDD